MQEPEAADAQEATDQHADEERLTCLKCRLELPANWFARTPGQDGTWRVDGWCRDCRGKLRAANRAPAKGTRRGDREYSNARSRAVAAANRRLREEHEATYQRYVREAAERTPLPPSDPGDAKRTQDRMNVHAQHARRAAQRLREDHAEAYEDYVETELRAQGYEPRRPRKR